MPDQPQSEPPYTCPVCGYAALEWEPYYGGQVPSFNMCPCCGTEFGFDDEPAASGIQVPFEDDREENREEFRRAAFSVLRRRWIEGGMRWFYPQVPPPPGWNPTDQLETLLRAGDTAAH
jgi:hypothetical protein